MAQLLASGFSILNERERNVLAARYFSADNTTFKELAQLYGITKQAIHLTEKKALDKLRGHFIKQGIPTVEEIFTDDDTNTGISDLSGQPVYRDQKKPAEGDSGLQATPEQLLQTWLNEIQEKQAMGKLAFVKGELLQKPLPKSIQEYLDGRLLYGGSPSGLLERAIAMATPDYD